MRFPVVISDAVWDTLKNRTSKDMTLNEAVEYLIMKFTLDNINKERETGNKTLLDQNEYLLLKVEFNKEMEKKKKVEPNANSRRRITIDI